MSCDIQLEARACIQEPPQRVAVGLHLHVITKHTMGNRHFLRHTGERVLPEVCAVGAAAEPAQHNTAADPLSCGASDGQGEMLLQVSIMAPCLQSKHLARTVQHAPVLACCIEKRL